MNVFHCMLLMHLNFVRVLLKFAISGKRYSGALRDFQLFVCVSEQV